MSRTVTVVTGTRADLGLWRPVLAELERRRPAVEVGLLVMAMHLDPRFGHTVDEVRRLGVPVIGEVACTPATDTPAAMAAALGTALEGAAAPLAETRPDWLLVLGDRGEQLAAALAAAHLGIAIAHLHGGERTAGAIDDVLRDLLSRLAQLHLVATDGAARRLQTMGIAPWRIHRTGAPGLDVVVAARPASAETRARYGLPARGPYVVVLLHPETGAGPEDPLVLARATLEAATSQDLPVLAIWPNADAGGRAIADLLGRFREHLSALEVSIPHDDFLALLCGAAALVGNSSSGIIEAPMLRVPAVNVGRRQEGRERGDNVIDAPPDAEAVRAALARALEPAFRARLSGTSPYGDGRAAPRIVEALLTTPIDGRLFDREAV